MAGLARAAAQPAELLPAAGVNLGCVMTQPLWTEAYKRWHESTGALHQNYLNWYANIGPQTNNAARLEVLKQVKAARVRMTDAEAQAIWPDSGCCDRCGCALSPGDPYRITSVGRGGAAVDVLYCIECAFGPNEWWSSSPPPVPPWAPLDIGRARVAFGDMIEEAQERCLRQERLSRRGAWGRLRNRVEWWSAPFWALHPTLLGREPGLLQRLVVSWQVRRLRRKMAIALKRGFTTRNQERMAEAGQRIVARYERGRRQFVKAELAGIRLAGASL